MSQHPSHQLSSSSVAAANLQSTNNQLVKCIEDLRQKRSVLSSEIQRDEEEKSKIGHNLQILREKLARVEEQLRRRQEGSQEYAKTLRETEGAYNSPNIPNGGTPIKIPGARPLHKSKLLNNKRRVPPRTNGGIKENPQRNGSVKSPLNGTADGDSHNQSAAADSSQQPWPLKAMEPKVWVPFENPPSGVPRRIVIERKRRDYLAKNIEDILAENGIDYSHPDSSERYESYLPLETFDDTEYDPRTPSEWMSLAFDEDGTRKCIPAVGFFYNKELKTGHWRDCKVVDYNREENSWLVETDFTQNDQQIWLPRIHLMFKAEDPEVFAQRVIKAHHARKEAESLLRYNLYIDSMPADEIPPLDSDRLQKIKAMSLNTPKLEEHEDRLQVDRLVDEVNITYSRTMNKIIFDTNMKNSNQQELFSFLSLPTDEEERPVPWSGVVQIPPHDFEVTFRSFRFQTYFSEPCILTALLKLREELLDTEERRVFAIPMKKVATLDEFEQIQKNEIEKLTKHLQEVWVKKIVAHIKSSLKNVGKGWLNIYESKRDIYDMSKLKRFITAVRFMMEDTLRFMTEDSIQEFVDFITVMCDYEVKVESVSEVHVEELNSEEDDSARMPLFAVEILYKDEGFRFSTDPQDFIEVLLRLFDQAVGEMRQIPQVEPYVMDQFFWSDINSLSAIHLKDDHVLEWRRHLEDTLTAALKPLQEYLALYSEFDTLMQRNISEYAKNFVEEEHTIDEIKKEVLSHRKQKKEILKRIPQRVNLGTFAVDCQTVRNALAKKCQQTADLILDLVSKRGKKMSLDVVNGFVKISRELNKPPQNIEQLTKTKEFQSGLHLRTEELNETIGGMKQVYDLLEGFKKSLSDEEFKQKCAALAWPKKLLEQNEKVETHLSKERDRFRERMLIDQDQFQKDLDSIDRVVSSFAKHQDLSRVGEVAHEVKILQKQIKEYQDRAKEFNSKEILFGMDISEYKQLSNIVKNFTPFANLWLTANDWINWQTAWLNDPFETIVAADIDDQAKKAKSTIAKCVKQFSQMPSILSIATEMRDKISDFEPRLPLIMALRNPGVRERHWKQMSESIGIDLVPDETIKTLQDVFDLNLMEHLEKIQKVSDFAAQEYTIEKALNNMKQAWETTEFDIKPYRETGTFVLKLNDELQQQLDDHIALTQTLGFSNFKKHFESEILAWDTQLNLISEIIEEWVNCQREWMALEPIFSAPEMIKQLPGLHKKFKTVDTKYRRAMESASNNPGALAFCSSNKVLKLFQDCNALLSTIQKGLNNYLETKRKQFARLYFLADDELLVILAQAQEPRHIQPYLKKCFASVEKVTFTEDNDITAMHSKGGEAVEFVEPVHAAGSVEVWLEQVESMMRQSVRKSLSDSILDYADVDRKDWVLRWPGQIIICGSQIFWTKRCEDALREKGLAGLKEYEDLLNRELRELTGLMSTDISKLERKKLGALITIDVHALTVIEEMVRRHVEAASNFKWVSQMRYYWEEDTCVVRQVESQFEYGYEYLGNDGRLVITPLTDRIYLTLTGALHLSLGGAPAGPAGTGKTETVKDLAKALAKQCVVFNCVSQNSLISVGSGNYGYTVEEIFEAAARVRAPQQNGSKHGSEFVDTSDFELLNFSSLSTTTPVDDDEYVRILLEEGSQPEEFGTPLALSQDGKVIRDTEAAIQSSSNDDDPCEEEQSTGIPEEVIEHTTVAETTRAAPRHTTSQDSRGFLYSQRTHANSVIRNNVSSKMLSFTLLDGTEFCCTPDHEIYVLEPNDHLCFKKAGDINLEVDRVVRGPYPFTKHIPPVNWLLPTTKSIKRTKSDRDEIFISDNVLDGHNFSTQTSEFIREHEILPIYVGEVDRVAAFARLTGAIISDGNIVKGDATLFVDEWEDACDVVRDARTLLKNARTQFKPKKQTRTHTQSNASQTTISISLGSVIGSLLHFVGGVPVGSKSTTEWKIASLWTDSPHTWIKREFLCGIWGGDRSHLTSRKVSMGALAWTSDPGQPRESLRNRMESIAQMMQDLGYEKPTIFALDTQPGTNDGFRVKPSNNDIMHHLATIDFAYAAHKRREQLKLAAFKRYQEHNTNANVKYNLEDFCDQYLSVGKNCPLRGHIPLPVFSCTETTEGSTYDITINSSDEGLHNFGVSGVVSHNCQEGLDEFAMGKFFKGLIMAGAWACFDEFNRIDVEVLSVVAQQITTLQEAVRAGLAECEFENTTVRVDPSYAVFITMNPGYAGRTELPDNLKALFRPVACMVPDYALIAEIRLFSFGFLQAKPLSQKMVATFRLSSEQLSSQDHYDFGMRALNTVIAAAGLLKREDPSLDEEILLLRALRDSNLPKFLPNDVILFDGIISDLFPGTKIPDVDYGALIKQIEDSCIHFSLQATDVFMKKVIQLYETTVLRHGLMIVGLTMGGKTSNYKVLAHALSKLAKVDSEKYKVVKTTVINPKSVSMAQLYGEYDRNTREWKDGVLANEFRTFVHDTSDTRKWLIFDGPVDALWIESMNTVLDDNRKLCLVSGAIIEMTSEMNIIFEVQDLAVASPATVSRCGMVYMEPSATAPVISLVKSWISNIGKMCKPLVDHADKIKKMLTDVMIPLIDYVSTNSQLEQYARAVPNNLATSCFNLLDSLFAPYNINKEAALMAGQNEEEIEKQLSKIPFLVEPLTVFALIWSTGASLTDKSRQLFDSKLREFMTKYKIQEDFPQDGLVYDYQFDQESIRWTHWLDTQPEFKLDPELSFSNIVVPTTDTIRYNFLLETLMKNNKHVLCVGPTGTGKTLTISKKIMSGMPKNFMPLFIFFSARTDANSTQDIIDGKLEKHRKGTYGPPIGSDYIIFVDDLNMPQLEEYGAQPPIELLRQWMDHGGWYEYNTERLNFRKVVKVQFAAAMGPPGGGRNPVTDRFLRHFNFVSFPEMDDRVVFKIFDTILNTWVSNKLPESIHSMSKTIVQASIDLYNKVRETMLPTPSKSHYTFNLRDLAKIFSGILSSNPKALHNETDILRLWIHESTRVFSDRLVDDHDRDTFRNLLKTYLQKDFTTEWDSVVDTSRRLIYGDFMQGAGGEGEYEEVKDMKELVRVMNEQLDYYNDAAEVPMNLVMFLDAIEHVARISRIIRQPGGNALLLGVGGSGRQSLTRLAAFMGEFKLFQVEISKSFDEKEWKEFLKQLMLESGKNDQPSVFLFTDTQIIKESFLEDINNLLNAGEIPNLMDPADLDEIYQEMKPLCAMERLPATPSSWYARFVKRIKENLHIVLAMSPTTDIFRTRLRMFPSLVTCCTIDWFSEWPPEGLFSVAENKFEILSTPEDVKKLIISACVYIHESVASISRTYFEQEGRSNHVTPTSYLELLQTFTTLLQQNNNKLKEDKKKFELGLKTLGKTEVEVEALQRMLEEKQPVLKKTQEDIKVNMKKIEVDKASAEETRVSVEKEEAVASAKARECQAIKDKCDADLQEALPLLDAALNSLKNLKVDNIKEVSSYKNPTKGVKLTMEAVMVMFGKKPAKSNKDGKTVIDYWEPAKLLLAKAKELRNDMISFDKESLTKSKIDRISKFIENPDFTPKEISRASKACTAMCEWVRAMYSYYHVNLKVKPLRIDLAKAEKELEVVEKSLAVAQKKLSDINSKIQQLEDENQKAIDKSQELADEVEQCTIKLSRADRLISGLAGEKQRWIQTLEDYAKQEENIIGNMVIAAGGVAYLGPFTAPFRKKLNALWTKKLDDVGLTYTPGYGLSNLVEGLQIRNWNSFGLPADALSIENAIIMSKARRWPLMIDPQLQANQWIKNMEKDNQLKVISLHQSDYLRTIVNAVQFGNPVLLENIGEELDPAIEPILLKQTFVQNGATYIRIGEDAVQYNADFRFYMTTKLRNPQYTPEASVRVTLLNFFITPKGLEDQLLGTVVKMETPELEQMKNDLMKQNVKMRNDLAKIQNNILKMINESGDEDILANEALINALEESKVASESIIEKVAQAETTEKEIDVTRNKYKPVAVRGSILFFCISDMTNVDPMYQYSLQWFIKLFTLGIENAEEDEVLEHRLKNLIDYFTYSLYHNVCQSLFAKHKLMFSFMLTIRILMGQDLIDPVEWRFFLTGTTAEKPENKPKPSAEWMTEKMWKEVLFLSTIEAFNGLPNKIENNIEEWHKYFDTTNVHEVTVPEYGDSISSLQKLLILRALRPDKVTDAIVDYVTEKLGKKFVMPPRFDLARSFKDSSNETPLVMILSAGADPKTEMNKFAESMRIKRFASISLGRGTEKKATQAIKDAIQEGSWVLLQNCHLATSFMPALESLVEEFSPDNHRDFRLWLTSMPTPKFPVSILQNSVKMTLEPPKGLQANLMGSFDALDDNSMTHESKPAEFKKLLFSLCFLHAIVQERRKFGPLGWNIPYEFTNGDLNICIQQLHLFLEKYDEVPYEVIRFLSGQINYGGRVTDDWDRRTLMNFVDKYLNDRVLEDGYKFSSRDEYYSIPVGDHKDYVHYIESLPLYTHPETFGLHENAEITYNITELVDTTDTILSMQPKGAGSSNKDEIIKSKAEEFLKSIPKPFDVQEIANRYPTMYEECMNTVLVQEVIRYNKLIKTIRKSLRELLKAIEGLVVMSEPLEKLNDSIFNNQVPDMWSTVAYPSLMPLGDWVVDLVARCKFIKGWAEKGHPSVYWISGFFFPQGFLTGALQNYARKYTVAIDRVKWDFEVLDAMNPEEISSPPEDGVYISGLYLEGADWDREKKLLCESKPKQLFTKMPIIWLKPVVDRKKPESGIYDCPTYKTLQRAGQLSTTGHSTNYILCIELPSDKPQEVYIGKGVAMLSALRFATV